MAENDSKAKTETKPKINFGNFAVPAAIIIAGLFVAAAIVYTKSADSVPNGDGKSFRNSLSGAAQNARAVDGTDHILGNPDAAVTVIEYSDFECPFCARFHPTLNRIIKESDGKVRWVYRHFPLTQIHSKAFGASIASECVAELGGNAAFWSFAKTMFGDQRKLGTEFYESTASSLGIPKGAFSACLNSEKHTNRVKSDFENAIASISGNPGTPFNIVIDKTGNRFPFMGALPYEQVREIINKALQD